jgi:phosphoribosylformylglycinamidine synthase subunit PurS
MRYIAEINVMPLEEILDPQGKAVLLGLKNLGVTGAEGVRVGRHITMHVEAVDEAEARVQVELACSKLLANPIMEGYQFSLSSLQD